MPGAAERVVLVGPAHPYKGGGARHTTELAHRLAAAGHPTVLESWRAQYPAALYPGRQTVHAPEGEPYPATRRDLAWYRPDGWLRTGRRAGRSADLVAVAALSPVQVPAYLVLLAGVGRAARTAVIAHNVLPHERRPGDTALMRALLRRAGTVLVHSAEQAGLARGLAPGADVRAAELPPHLPETGPAPVGRPREPGPPRFLFFGIVRPYKGVDVLLRAFAAGAPPGALLTVAGEFWGGSAELRGLARELGVADRVEFREGYVPAGELGALFAAADAAVLPYRSATATQNVLLAQRHGLPVIATRTGTLPDAVRDGADGLLCAPGDPEDLARALAAFAAPGTAERLRAGAAEAAARTAARTDALWDAYLHALTAR
ncbi:glycosyltransferase [Nocardiopsis composta]|uniref:Glycosyltransferase involved in cell wall biosynthesis n=1 Tax=Nocardiopsis composta TaxID=157465 RepID=A0A7W8QM72_9ACTN|nr:glycosyltransferase [Nocardiopsis composta]MBB5432890.1 glycosyltransferase involved in cell wall biosynthesis [Nocardiopsis composta]